MNVCLDRMSFWTHGGLLMGPTRLGYWVILVQMRYFWDFAQLYTSLLGVSCIYSGKGNPSGLLELGQLTIVDYQVANYTRQGVPRKSLVNERLRTRIIVL